jgi:hypothetical protein
MDRNFLETAAQNIGKLIGQPIDPNLPVPPVLAEIFDYETADPGEKVQTYNVEDTNGGDTITAVGIGGVISEYKITPQTPADITFSTVQSRLERVQVDEILNSPDQKVIARRKRAITRALDKKVTKEALDLILAKSSQEVVQASGMDLYDLVLGLKHKIQDYGDNYILLVGSDVDNKIDTWEKDQATNFNYLVSLEKKLAEKNIKLVRVAEVVEFNYIASDTSGSPETDNIKVLAAGKLIMVARNSFIQEGGKPGIYVRRKFSPEIAAMMGSEVDATFRATSVIPMPVNEGGYNTLCFGIHAVEQRICALLNYRGVAWATLA